MKLLETLANKAITQILANADLVSKEKRVETAAWLQQPKEPLLDGAQALAYLGESYTSRSSPLVYVVTQDHYESWPLHAPHIMSADRAANGLMGEIFKERQHE